MPTPYARRIEAIEARGIVNTKAIHEDILPTLNTVAVDVKTMKDWLEDIGINNGNRAILKQVVSSVAEEIAIKHALSLWLKMRFGWLYNIQTVLKVAGLLSVIAVGTQAFVWIAHQYHKFGL